MAIVAKFDADFSAFSAGTKQAEREIEAFAATVESSVVSVADMEQAFRDMDDPVSGMNTQFSEFDSILKLAGVNIGTYNKALGELGGLLGLNASTLALLGPAAAVVGTALAAWEVGTRIGEWSGLTDAIANGTAELLGWGSAADEAAGAKADAMGQAFVNTGVFARDAAHALELNTKFLKENAAQQAITTEAVKKANEGWAEHVRTMNEANNERAIKFVQDAQRKYQESVKASRDELHNWSAAMTEVRLAEGAWLEVVNAMNPALVDRAKNLMAEGVSTEALKVALELTDVQIQAVSRSRQFDNEMMREAKGLKEELIPVVEDLATALYNEAKAIDETARANQGAAAATAAVATARANTLTFTAVPSGGTPLRGEQQNLSRLGGHMPTHVMGPMRPPIITNYVNVNGIMMSDDPAAKQALAQAIDMAMMQGTAHPSMKRSAA